MYILINKFHSMKLVYEEVWFILLFRDPFQTNVPLKCILIWNWLIKKYWSNKSYLVT